MTENQTVTRRVILTAGTTGLVGASTLLLAACSTGGADTAAPAASSAATGSATGSATAPSGASSGAAAASGAEIAKLADVPVGQATSVTFDGQELLVAQPTAGTVVAFSSVCPHQGCAVAFAKTDFACPCHGSTFELATGDVTHGPAQKGLTAVKVAVSGDTIVAA
ncbi:Rieske (2Fe-2S) protein [Subtercola boreus]|uniref:Rieske (2Fe-2S) protein n=1 Tax=Subtercola boreus TaxID=120213 RepID=UPI001C0EE69C|nr:Rieske (2Fe-2S) protein [Subtercola boreus]